MQKCPCNNLAIGSANGHWFCANVTCIDAAMGKATEPVKMALERAVEPCDDCWQTRGQENECDGGPFCGCPCHDGILRPKEK